MKFSLHATFNPTSHEQALWILTDATALQENVAS